MVSHSTGQFLQRSAVLLLGLTFACAGSSGSAAASGGTKNGQGGFASGGVSSAGGVSTGGQADSGGASGGGGSSSSASGGNTSLNGGSAAGGTSASGGAISGTGGFAPGGNASGGNAAGGVATGGRGGFGGAATGGAATGGVATGGAASGGSATGGITTGGRSGSGGSAVGGSTGTDPFTLAWQDDFNSFDTSLWQLMSFTYDGNQATFSPNNASVANGKLTISLTNAPSGSAKPYLGVEMRSTKTITYGKVSASMRFASGSGVVSGLVLFYTPYPNCNWNEIDIEHLGKSTTSSQLNCMIYTGNVAPTCTASVTPTQDPQVVDLGANAETAFHQYDIEWTPAAVKFFIDGKLLRTWTANIALMNQPLTVLLTIWASSAASWAGAIDASAIPTSADVDWIKVYSWKG